MFSVVFDNSTCVWSYFFFIQLHPQTDTPDSAPASPPMISYLSDLASVRRDGCTIATPDEMLTGKAQLAVFAHRAAYLALNAFEAVNEKRKSMSRA